LGGCGRAGARGGSGGVGGSLGLGPGVGAEANHHATRSQRQRNLAMKSEFQGAPAWDNTSTREKASRWVRRGLTRQVEFSGCSRHGFGQAP
jgi:hypothetical protein